MLSAYPTALAPTVAPDLARGAQEVALAAYLDGFEPVEPALTARDSASCRGTAMGAFRVSLTKGIFRPVFDRHYRK